MTQTNGNKIPSWAATLLLASLPALLAAAATGGAMHWRLTALEQKQTGYELATANTGAIAVLRAELSAVQARTSDQAHADYWANRAKVAQEIEGLQRRIKRLERQ